MFGKLKALLQEHEDGFISERCLSFVLALRVMDYLETPRKSIG